VCVCVCVCVILKIKSSPSFELSCFFSLSLYLLSICISLLSLLLLSPLTSSSIFIKQDFRHTPMYRLVFLFLFLSLCHFTDSICFPFVLQNECTSVVSSNGVPFDPELQRIIFEFLAPTISDIRMVLSQCRRPLLWYLCGLSFPPCYETDEQRICRETEGCRQVDELCSEFTLSLGCSNNSSFEKITERQVLDIISACSTRIEEAIEEVSRDPVKVETCLGEDRQSIKCCPDPFTADSGGECVVKCMQYLFGKKWEYGMIIVLFIIAVFGLITCIVCLIPILFIKRSLNFRFTLIFLQIMNHDLTCNSNLQVSAYCINSFNVCEPCTLFFYQPNCTLCRFSSRFLLLLLKIYVR